MSLNDFADKWQAVRQAVLERDGFRCRSNRPHSDLTKDPTNLDVHHLIPRFLGGTDDHSNLITLCDRCHATRHPNLQMGLSRRLIVRWGLRLARWLDFRKELPDNMDSILGALRLIGHDRLRQGQLDIILAALRGESMLVVQPTGYGKSLCFQLPALMRPGGGLVLSPLKALMQDQVSNLQELEIPATFINSDLPRKEKEARFRLWERSGFKLLYCAPERFDAKRVMNPAEINRLAKVKPSFLIVDEAHCVDRWGQDFRPAYAQISQIRKRLENPPILAFTATASPPTQDRILDSLGVPAAKRFLADIDRPNIALIRLQVFNDRMKVKITDALLRQQWPGRSLIFVPTKRIGEEAQKAFKSLNRELPFFHGNLPLLKREEILGRFTGRLEPELKTVICTNAFGMGIDVPDIRLIIHWRHPASVEDYLQELGRSGRDGKRSLAVLFTVNADEEGRLLKWMAKKTVESSKHPPEEKEKIRKLRHNQIDEMGEMVAFPKATMCFRRELLHYMGVETRRRRRSFVRWLFDLLFVREPRVLRSWACCDVCNKKLADSIKKCEFPLLDNT